MRPAVHRTEPAGAGKGNAGIGTADTLKPSIFKHTDYDKLLNHPAPILAEIDANESEF